MNEEIKSKISFLKRRLHQLKEDGFLRASSLTDSNKFGTIEAQRRRQEIKELEKNNENV